MNVSLSSALNTPKFGNIYTLRSNQYGIDHPVPLAGDDRLLALQVGQYLHPGTPAEESGHGDVWQTLGYPRGNTLILDGDELKDYKKVNSDLSRIREMSQDPMVKQAVFIAELQHDMAVAKAATPLDVTAIQEHRDQFPIQPSAAATLSSAAAPTEPASLPPQQQPDMPQFMPGQTGIPGQPNPFAQIGPAGGMPVAPAAPAQ